MFEKVLAFLFNRYCFFCGNLLRVKESKLCEKCYNKIENFKGMVTCKKCGRPLNSAYPLNLEYTCGICRNKRLPYSELYVYGPYTGKLRDLLIALKFRNQFWISRVISNLLLSDERFADFISDADLLLPVPLHPKRLDSRGFNQVYLFTKELRKRLGLNIPISKCDVLRVKETEFQKSLTLRRRILNLRKAFEVNNISAIQDKKIILIDDILTTGATVMSVSKLLRKSGAKEIKVIIIAR